MAGGIAAATWSLDATDRIDLFWRDDVFAMSHIDGDGSKWTSNRIGPLKPRDAGVAGRPRRDLHHRPGSSVDARATPVGPADVPATGPSRTGCHAHTGTAGFGRGDRSGDRSKFHPVPPPIPLGGHDVSDGLHRESHSSAARPRIAAAPRGGHRKWGGRSEPSLIDSVMTPLYGAGGPVAATLTARVRNGGANRQL